jgi:hypothetical protein
MTDSNPNEPTFVFDQLPLAWQMARCEKFALAALLNVIRPDAAIEIGTYKGGSLQIISAHSSRVYSIDISDEPARNLSDTFPNTEFLVGKSRELIPVALSRLAAENHTLDFVLVDGDHSTEGVRGDIEALLAYRPKHRLYIALHDSFHPPTRRGILSAGWANSEYVHFVEIDFIPGVFHQEAFDTAAPKSMYGGLALAVMDPTPRRSDLSIRQSQQGLFDIVYPQSRHAALSERLKTGPLGAVKRKLLG